jgi:PIN domain nuclease of toxin-antitoxin system
VKLLLDTHVVLWWSSGARLSDRATDAIEAAENEVVVSVVTYWETEIKIQAGRLEVDDDLPERLYEHGVEELPIKRHHALTAARLPRHHGDPFDRVLMGQALVEGMVLVTRDSMFARYDVPLLKA